MNFGGKGRCFSHGTAQPSSPPPQQPSDKSRAPAVLGPSVVTERICGTMGRGFDLDLTPCINGCVRYARLSSVSSPMIPGAGSIADRARQGQACRRFLCVGPPSDVQPRWGVKAEAHQKRTRPPHKPPCLSFSAYQLISSRLSRPRRPRLLGRRVATRRPATTSGRSR